MDKNQGNKQKVCVVHIKQIVFSDEFRGSYLPESWPIFGVYSTRLKAEQAVWDYFAKFKGQCKLCFGDFDIYGEILDCDICIKREDKSIGGCAFYCINFYLKTIDV